jgi:hypothetical protein
MRIALSALVPTGQPTKLGRTWYVTVARKDGVPVLSNTVVSFTTKTAAMAFASSIATCPTCGHVQASTEHPTWCDCATEGCRCRSLHWMFDWDAERQVWVLA